MASVDPFTGETVEEEEELGWGEWAGDVGQAVMGRFADLGGMVGGAMDWIGTETGAEGLAETGRSIKERGERSAKWWEDQLSEQFERTLKTPYVQRDEDGGFDVDLSLGKVLVDALGSAPFTLTGLKTGQLVTRGLQTLGGKIGKVRAMQAAADAGSSSAKVGLNTINMVAGATGYGISEGALEAGMNAAGTFAEVKSMDHADLMEDSPRYLQIFNSTDPSEPKEDRIAYAKEALAGDAANSAAWKTFLATGAAGAPMGAVFGRLFKSPLGSEFATGKVGATAIGAAGEAAQEAVQEGSQEVIGETTIEEYTGKEAGDLWETALNAAVGGAAAGGAMGAVFGAVEGETKASKSQRRMAQDLRGTIQVLEEKGLENEMDGVLGWREDGVSNRQVIDGLRELARTGQIPQHPQDMNTGEAPKFKLAELPEKIQSSLRERLEQARKIAPEFSETIRRARSAIPDAWDMGVNFKEEDSAADKVERKGYYDENGKLKPGKPDDLIRTTVVVPRPEDAEKVVNSLKMQGVVADPNDIRRTLADPEVKGYKDFQLNTKHSKGAKAEVQINVPEMLIGKVVGHKLFEQQRDFDKEAEKDEKGRAILSEEAIESKRELQRLQEDFYDVVQESAAEMSFEELSEKFAELDQIEDKKQKVKETYSFLESITSTRSKKSLREVAGRVAELGGKPLTPSSVSKSAPYREGGPGSRTGPSSSKRKVDPSGGSRKSSIVGSSSAIEPSISREPQKAEETTKEYMKRVVDQEPTPTDLPDDQELYFDLDEDTNMVPVESAVPRKSQAEIDKTRENAAKRMRASAEGAIPRRPPLTGVKLSDGSWLVLDGNASISAAQDYGFEAIPVKEATAEERQEHAEDIQRAEERIDAETVRVDTGQPEVTGREQQEGEAGRRRDVQQEPEAGSEAGNREGRVERQGEQEGRQEEGPEAAQQHQEAAPVSLPKRVAERYTRVDEGAAPEEAQAAIDRETDRNAALSPRNEYPEPTDAQKSAGNYRKGRLKLQGLNISIENPKGSIRRSKPGQRKWSRKMKRHYGYIASVDRDGKRVPTMGKDKDYLDVFLGPGAHNPMLPVFVVDQVNRDGSLDEHKVMLGFESEGAAKSAYMAEYPTGWHGFGDITQMTPSEFKDWATQPDKEQPVGDVSSETSRETTNFQRWFGDSKVTDAKGEPLVVYHGTSRDLTVFDPGQSRSGAAGPAGWFSRNTGLASDYAQGTSRLRRRAGEEVAEQVYPAYLKVDNPLRINVDANRKLVHGELEERVGFTFDSIEYKPTGPPIRVFRDDGQYPYETQKREVHRYVNSPEFMAAAREAGYDGIQIFERGMETWAPFDSEQVKSAIGNIGTYDPANPDIRYKLRKKYRRRQPPGEPVDAKTRAKNFARLKQDTEVVDENGDPKVVYVGTVGDFTVFDPGRRGVRTGDLDAAHAFSFADSPALASRYAAAFGLNREAMELKSQLEKHRREMKNLAAKMNVANPFGNEMPKLREQYDAAKDKASKVEQALSDQVADVIRDQRYEGVVSGANVMPVYLRMTNPLVVDMEKHGNYYDPKIHHGYIRRAKMKGHDGVIFKNIIDDVMLPTELEQVSPDKQRETTTTYAVFEPEQIKSATGNLGTFDFTNPDIRYRLTKEGETFRRRPPQPESKSFEVIHLDNKKGLNMLMGDYGQGTSSEERHRLRDPDTPDYLKQRSYHYVMEGGTGRMPQYERLVSSRAPNVYRTRLSNIFDGNVAFSDRSEREQGIIKRAEAREKNGENFGTALEDEVYSAGYDGMRVGNVVTAFGPGVPVRAAGEIGDPRLERNPRQNVVAFENIPGSGLFEGEWIMDEDPDTQREFAREAVTTIDGTRDLLAEKLGFDGFYTYSAQGAYDGQIRPNYLAEAPNAEAADIYAKAIKHIYDQDAVGWFRATQDTSQPLGMVFRFHGAMRPAAEREFYDRLKYWFGEDAGYSRTEPNEFVVINFHDENGNPMMDNEWFREQAGYLAEEFKLDLINGRHTETHFEADLITQGEKELEASISDWGGADLLSWVRNQRERQREAVKEFRRRIEQQRRKESISGTRTRITEEHREKARRLYDPEREREAERLNKRVKKKVKELRTDFRGIGRIKVFRNAYQDEIPDRIRQYTLGLPSHAVPEALFDPVENNIYVFSDEMAFDPKTDPLEGVYSESDKIERAVFEEMFHQGLRRAFGSEFNEFLNAASKALSAEDLRPIHELYSHLDPRVTQDRLALVEEYIAKMDPQENPTLWERFVGWVRDWARRKGFRWAQDLNTFDLRRIMRRLYHGIRTGKIESPAYRGPVRYAPEIFLNDEGQMVIDRQGQQAPVPADWEAPSETQQDFDKWFGNSLIVDTAGRPREVFYAASGIHQDTTEFRMDELPADDPELPYVGYHFTTNINDAEAESRRKQERTNKDFVQPVVAPAFLAIENPVTQEEARRIKEDVDPDMPGGEFREYLESLGYDGIIHERAEVSEADRSMLDEQGTLYITEDQYLQTNEKGSIDYYAGGEKVTEYSNFDEVLNSTLGEGVFIPFYPEQVKSSVYNMGFYGRDESDTTFRLAKERGEQPMFRMRRRKGSEAQERVLEDTLHHIPEDLGLFGKLKYFAARLRQVFAEEGSWGVKQALFDTQAAIERVERERNDGKLLDAAESAFKAAKLAQNLPGVMTAAFQAGIPVYRNGGFEAADDGRIGIADVFRPLFEHESGESLLPLWEGYAAALSAEELIDQQNPDGTSREKLFSREQIEEMKKLEEEYPFFRTVFDNWQAINRQALDLAVETGALSQEERDSWQRNMYVPFYRAMEDMENVNNPLGEGRGLAGTLKTKRLYGGEQKLDSVFENMLMNVSYLVDRSMKAIAMQRVAALGEDAGVMEKVPMPVKAIKFSNRELARALMKGGLLAGSPFTEAAQRSRQALSEADALEEAVQVVEEMSERQKEQWATLFRRVKPVGPDVVTVMENGNPSYYRVLDPGYLQSIEGLNTDSFGSIMAIASGAKRILTKSVTSTPGFMVANTFRDTLSTWLISDVNIPFAGFMSNAREIWNEEGTALDIMAAGGSTGGFFGVDRQNYRKMVEHELGGKGTARYMATMVNPFAPRGLMQSIGNVSENLNRLAVAKQVRKNGGSKAEAAFQAMDVMNFSNSGSMMQPFIRTIPFLNARLQGLYRLWRGARSDDLQGWRTSFLAKGGLLTMASLALALSNEGEEEYEQVPDWDKDINWHFFIDGKHYRFPKPFEVGVMFATLPERAYRFFRGHDDGDTFQDAMFRAVTETFAMNPVPQVAKPFVEQWANRSFFTGNPIINMSMEGVEPEAQAMPWTSETARVVADLAPDWAPDWARSPIRLEHLVRGFFGTMAMYGMDTVDVMARKAAGMPEPPASRLENMPLAYRFYQGDPETSKQNRYQDELYKTLSDANSIYRTINRYEKQGEVDKMRELIRGNEELLAWRKTLNDISTELRKLNQAERELMRNPMMSAEKKRARLDRLIRTRNNMLNSFGPQFETMD